jgi:Ca2+-binding EF-hand superfamily protein
MHRLDLNRDGEVSADEILGVISGGQTVSSSSIDKLVEKLAAGGKSFSSVKDYARALIRKFDRDNDGIITFEELCDGLIKMNIKVSYAEQ